MLQRSARIKSKQLKLVGEQDPEGNINMDDLPNDTEEVAKVGTAANDVNSGTEEKDEAGSSSSSPLTIPSAMEKALQNPVILKNLFQVCPASILASCRLVSKQWYDVSLLTLRSKFPLTLGMGKTDIFIIRGDPNYYAGKQLPPNTFTPLNEFLEFCEKPEHQCDTKPHRKFTIEGCKFSLNSGEFELFWTAIGRNLTRLQFSECRFTNDNEFFRIVNKGCPLLQSLGIKYCSFPFESGVVEHTVLEYTEPIYGEHKNLKSLAVSYDARHCPISWMKVFSHFSSLTSFQIHYPDPPKDTADPVLETLSTVIREIRRRDKMKLPFKRFKCYPFFSISRDPECYRQFAILVKELRLPLANCCIKVHPELDGSLLRRTLGYIAESVNFINVTMYYSDNKADQVTCPIWFLDFPFGTQMNNLTTLFLDGGVCRNFAFLKYAPNLSRLKISDPSPPNGSYTSTTEAISNTCKEEFTNLKMIRLTTFRFDFIVSDDDLQQLFKWMPNIRILDMVLNDRQLGMVCENWKVLNVLRVHGTLLTRSAIGVELRRNVARLEGVRALRVNMKLYPKSVFDLFLHIPSLRSLQYDKVFEGPVNMYCHPPVERKDVDISAYQRAIQDNIAEQWIADNKHILEKSYLASRNLS